MNIENIAESLLIKLEEFKVEWENSTNHTFKNKIILSENFLHSNIHGINYITGITDSIYFKLKVSDVYYIYFFDFFSKDIENIESINEYKKYQKKLWKINDVLNFVVETLKPSDITLKLKEKDYNHKITIPLNKIKLTLENIHNENIKISDEEYFIDDSWKYFNIGYYLLNSKWLNKVPNEVIFKNKNDIKSDYFSDNEVIKYEDYLTASYFFEKAIKINNDFLLAKIYRLVALLNYDFYEGGYVSDVYNNFSSIIEDNPDCSIAHIHFADFYSRNEHYFYDNDKNNISIDINTKIKKHINLAIKKSKQKSSFIYYKAAIIENFRYRYKSSISFFYEAQSLQQSSKIFVLLKSAELNNEESDNMRFMKLETILNSEIPIYSSQYYYWTVWNELYSLKNFKELFDIDHEGYENMLIKYSSYTRKNQNLYKDYASFKYCNCKIDTTTSQIKITIDETYSNIIESNKLLFF